MKNYTHLMAFLLITWFIMACKKSDKQTPENEVPKEELVLLDKVYKDGQLFLELGYDEQHKIRRIDHFEDNGKLKSSQLILLDDLGRIEKVIMDFGHYTSTKTLTYDGNRKVSMETVNEFDNGSPSTYGKRIWQYPETNVIVDLLYGSDLASVNYTHTFTFQESGNIEKKVREVRLQPQQNNYELFQYDKGLSYEYMIESNIPGYSDFPISKNQLLNRKIFAADGELMAEVKYRNIYNKDGYLEKYTEESLNSVEEYTLHYKKVDLP